LLFHNTLPFVARRKCIKRERGCRHAASEEGIYVLDGTIRATLDGETYEATAGSFLIIPWGLPHEIRNTEGSAASRTWRPPTIRWTLEIGAGRNPTIVLPADGEWLHAGGAIYSMKACGSVTAQAYTLIEVLIEPTGIMPSLPDHRWQDDLDTDLARLHAVGLRFGIFE
jgi:Cupin domain